MYLCINHNNKDELHQIKLVRWTFRFALKRLAFSLFPEIEINEMLCARTQPSFHSEFLSAQRYESNHNHVSTIVQYSV